MSVLPGPGELDRIRAVFDDAMPSVAAFTRRSRAKNTMGGRDNALEPVPSMQAVPCHVHPDTQRGATEGEQVSRMAGDERFRIMFPVGTDAQNADVVDVDGRTYELISVDPGRSIPLEVEALAVRRS